MESDHLMQFYTEIMTIDEEGSGASQRSKKKL